MLADAGTGPLAPSPPIIMKPTNVPTTAPAPIHARASNGTVTNSASRTFPTRIELNIGRVDIIHQLGFTQ